MESSSLHTGNEFERNIKKYLKQGREKLSNELSGTREAIKLVAEEKTREFMMAMDKGLSKTEREYMSALIISGMYQSFCYGYGIGKVEGTTNRKIYL